MSHSTDSTPGTTYPARQTLTVDEVAAILGIGRNTAYTLVAQRMIPALRVGRRWIIPKASFDAWLTGEQQHGMRN